MTTSFFNKILIKTLLMLKDQGHTRGGWGKVRILSYPPLDYFCHTAELRPLKFHGTREYNRTV